MKFPKKIFRRPGLQSVLCWLGALYIRLVRATGRWSVEGEEIPRRYWDGGRPFVLCFWHGRLLMMPLCWRAGVPIHMLVSAHPDGRLIAATSASFGIRTIAGSTTRGGGVALRAMVRLLRSGACVGITPDGPRGPRMRAGLGVASLARLSGAAVVPCTYAVSRRRVLRSWDRFVLALPFGRGVIVWGRPVEVPPGADGTALEAARRRIEDELNAITAEADRRVGCAPIEPAPLGEGVPA